MKLLHVDHFIYSDLDERICRISKCRDDTSIVKVVSIVGRKHKTYLIYLGKQPKCWKQTSLCCHPESHEFIFQAIAHNILHTAGFFTGQRVWSALYSFLAWIFLGWGKTLDFIALEFASIFAAL